MSGRYATTRHPGVTRAALCVCLAAGFAPARSALAQEPAKAPLAPVVGHPGRTPETRDPFWPVGYFPGAQPGQRIEQGGTSAATNFVVQPTEEAFEAKIDWEAALSKHLAILGKGASAKGTYVVLRGVGMAKEGDVITISHRGYVYQWRIDRIGEKLDLSRLDVVPEKK